MKLKEYSVIPGFKRTLGFTLFYLILVVIIPLSGLLLKSTTLGWEHFWHAISSARTVAALKLSFTTSLISALINSVFGLLVAWVLVRYEFPFKKFFDAIVDLPFALPTAVAGISLTTLYGPNGWIGSWLHDMGIKTAFSPLGITIALTFIGLPFVVRTVEPILQDMESELEEAAFSLGANRWQVFVKVIFPGVLPALLTGTVLAFSRCLGEYGSVVFIAGNMPMKTEIAPLLIMTKLEQYDYAGATAIAVAMLSVSFLILLIVNYLHSLTRKHEKI